VFFVEGRRTMSALEQARKVYGRLRAQRNGHPLPASRRPSPYEENEGYEEIQPQRQPAAPSLPGPLYEENEGYEDIQRSPVPALSGAETGHEENEENEEIRPSSAGVRYALVTDPSALARVAAAIDKASLVALDIETAGDAAGDALDPRKGRVRLL